MYEAYAEYSDGSRIKQLLEADNALSDDEQQYRIECWLIERKSECTFYSVTYIGE